MPPTVDPPERIPDGLFCVVESSAVFVNPFVVCDSGLCIFVVAALNLLMCLPACLVCLRLECLPSKDTVDATADGDDSTITVVISIFVRVNEVGVQAVVNLVVDVSAGGLRLCRAEM